jgi:predicted nucleic acid-binding protein
MSDVVVVDANLALKWVILEQDSNTSMMLLDKWTDEGKEIIAPALFAYEVTNILYRQTLTNKLTYDEASQGLTKLFAIGVSIKFSLYENISVQAMELAHRFGLSATYDAHYLALAQHENCEFWTADTRLWNTVKSKLGWVRWFGDYHPEFME